MILMQLTRYGSFSWTPILEKGGPKDHFAIYLVIEAAFSSGRGWLCLPLKDTLRRKTGLSSPCSLRA